MESSEQEEFPENMPCASLIFPSKHSIYVRVERKIEGKHPWFGLGSPMGFAVSYSPEGPFIQGGRIRIPYNQQTSFEIRDAQGHPFYITSDRVGGKRDLVGNLMRSPKHPDAPLAHYIRAFGPVSEDDGTMVFIPKKHLLLDKGQRMVLEEGSDVVRVFYQCDNHAYMGGVLEIVPNTENIIPMEHAAGARFGRNRIGVRLKAWKKMDGLNQPTFGVSSRDQKGRFFYIGEQEGKIWEVDTFTTVRSPPPMGREDPMEHAGMWGELSLFMDASLFMEGVYSRRYPYAGVNVEERGLLGMAFHPQYHEPHAPNRDLFFLYLSSHPTNYSDITENHTGCLYRFKVIRTPPEMNASGDPTTGAQILCISEPFGNHNGGTLGFSPRDHMLYIGLGDGGSQGDPSDRAQDMKSFHGKILRIDVDAYDLNMHYRVPADNPFVSFMKGGGKPEIYALGFRNPWGFDFDSRGRLVVADTGEKIAEEVNEVRKGGFYGWSFREGHKRRKKPIGKESRAKVRKAIGPVYSYKHTKASLYNNKEYPARHAIVGAKVYTGTKYPMLRGTTIIADMSGWLGVLARVSGKRYNLVEQGHLPVGETIRALCKHLDGTVYALTHNKSRGEKGGAIWEISL